jgi:hypothetical protein
MNTLVYFQPDQETLLENDFESYSVWLTKEELLKTFPGAIIQEFSKNDIGIPTFVDATQIIVGDLILAEAISEYANMQFNSNYFEETENSDIHIVGIITVSDFIDMLSNIKDFLNANGDLEDVTEEMIEILKRIQDMDSNTILSFEFID